jgi:hypothetical protein
VSMGDVIKIPLFQNLPEETRFKLEAAYEAVKQRAPSFPWDRVPLKDLANWLGANRNKSMLAMRLGWFLYEHLKDVDISVLKAAAMEARQFEQMTDKEASEFLLEKATILFSGDE